MIDDNYTDYELEYFGEPAPRRKWIAAMLGLLSPGLGWVYVGRTVGVMNTALPLTLVWWGAYLLFERHDYAPFLPAKVLLSLTIALTLWAAFRAERRARRIGDNYILGESNSPLAYVFLAGMSWWLPMALLFLWVIPSQWAVVEVETEAMYPTLQRGDRVLVRKVRTEHDVRMFQHGDVLVLRTAGDGRTVARLAGMPNERVAMAEDTVYINDAANVRVLVDAAQVQSWVATTQPVMDDSERAYIEIANERVYLSSAPRMVSWGDPETWDLDEEQYFVLNDRRGMMGDSRMIGPIPRSYVVGVATFLVSSAERETSALRAGRRIQPPYVPRPVYDEDAGN